MSFTFRLETLLKVRKQERDEAAAAVTDTLALLAEVDSERNDIERENAILKKRFGQMRTGVLSAESLRLQDEHQERLQLRRIRLNERTEKLEQKLETHRQKLATADRELEQVELLRQRDSTAYQAERRRIEKRKLADTIASRVGRKRVA